MKIEIRLRIEAGDGGPCDEELLVLDKPHDRLEQVASTSDATPTPSRTTPSGTAMASGSRQPSRSPP